MLPKIPTQNTTTDVTGTMPPSGPETDTAMGTVTDLGAIELSISRPAPNAMAIYTTLSTPATQPARVAIPTWSRLPRSCSTCS